MFINWLFSVFRLFNGLFFIISETLPMVSLLSVLIAFTVMRCSYSYGLIGYISYLFLLILPFFMSLFLFRLVENCRLFFGGFVPVGSPLWISPFVCIAELISYFVRPFVLLFRPFINLSVGCYGGLAIGSFCFSFGELSFVFLFFLFIYEVFVALMHWFIVREILEFSVNH